MVRGGAKLKARYLWIIPIAAATLLLAGPPAYSGQSGSDPVLARLDSLAAAQARMMEQLKRLESQIAELRSPTAARTQPPAPRVPSAPLRFGDAAVRGDPTAKVVVMEFTDFQCPFCGAFARQTFPQLDADYVSTGRIAFAVRNFPLQEIHPMAVNAAETAQCALAQGRFWEMHDRLFSDQTKLDQRNLSGHATSLGLDMAAFADCVRGEGATMVKADLANARALGLSGTPTFLVGTNNGDGTMRVVNVFTGARDYASFKSVIDPLLAK